MRSFRANRANLLNLILLAYYTTCKLAHNKNYHLYLYFATHFTGTITPSTKLGGSQDKCNLSSLKKIYRLVEDTENLRFQNL